MNNEFIKEERIEGFSREQLLTLCVETVKALNWRIIHICSEGIVASSVIHNNEEKFITVSDQCIKFKSTKVKGVSFNYEFEQENSNFFFVKLHYLKENISAEEIQTMYEELSSSEIFFKDKKLVLQKKSFKDKIAELSSFFILKEGFYVTPILFYINVLIYILMLTTGYTSEDDLIKWGANYSPLTIDQGQWWRLFTCMFIHGGFLHLLMNMLALLYVGSMVEPVIGKLNFSILYLLTGLVASATSIYWHNDLSVCIGASGAIMGLIGIFWILVKKNIIHDSERKRILINIGIFILYSVVHKTKDSDGITDNAAHMGGALSGLILGYIYSSSFKLPDNKMIKTLTITISSILTLAVVLFILEITPQVFNMYNDKALLLQKHESNAVDLYSKGMNNNVELDTMINKLSEGLKEWYMCDSILTIMDQIAVPKEMKEEHPKLHAYINLRIETFQMQIHYLQTDSLDKDLYDKKEQELDSLYSLIEN